MTDAPWKPRKVVIVGAGAVGSTFAYTLAQSGLADEIVLKDSRHELAMGQVLDLAHGQAFFPSVQIREAEANDFADAHIIVITAGSKQRPGESRLDLLQRNVKIIYEIIDEIVAQKSSAVVLMVSNPVDILTYAAYKRSGWPRGRIIGSGTVLDSARFRYLLSQDCGVDVHNVHAYILGEHGDSEFPAWSMTNVAGLSMDQYCNQCAKCEQLKVNRGKIAEEVRHSAYHIIEYKGATWFGVGLAFDADCRVHPAQPAWSAHGFVGSGWGIRTEGREPGSSLHSFSEWRGTRLAGRFAIRRASRPRKLRHHTEGPDQAARSGIGIR
jgi:L-lactate dehydrogenase